MDTKHAIKLFEDKKVRSVWDAEVEKWSILIVYGVHGAHQFAPGAQRAIQMPENSADCRRRAL